jgi:hypothetical protein
MPQLEILVAPGEPNGSMRLNLRESTKIRGQSLVTPNFVSEN